MPASALLVVGGLLLAVLPVAAQTQPYRAPRTADGKPNLNGIWQALNEANWDIEGHAAGMGRVTALGAADSIPPGLGVVEGGPIPYLPGAAAKKKENFEKRLTLDPEIKCYLPGVPRATYMPQPFQIIQSPKNIMILHQYAKAVRTIYMENQTEAPADSWMGWSNGHWEKPCSSTPPVSMTRRGSTGPEIFTATPCTLSNALPPQARII
jgi:hypothetical protein